MNCVVYKGRARPDTYLFVEHAGDWSRVPASLLQQMGELEEVMTLELTPERRLARVDATVLMTALQGDGFYLQLPPRDNIPFAS